jgi:hypothetical protein
MTAKAQAISIPFMTSPMGDFFAIPTSMHHRCRECCDQKTTVFAQLATVLTFDEARRIAVNVAKLSGLLSVK